MNDIAGMAILEELFQELSVLLKEHGEEIDHDDDVSFSDTILRTYAMSDLVYYEEDDAPLMVEFVLFAEIMLLLPNGKVHLTNDKGDEWDIVDKGMLSAIASFLKWRSKILKQLKL